VKSMFMTLLSRACNGQDANGGGCQPARQARAARCR
jgi:hypothetical protein